MDVDVEEKLEVEEPEDRGLVSSRVNRGRGGYWLTILRSM